MSNEIPKPKFNVGEKVFVIESGKIHEKIVTGICALFNEGNTFITNKAMFDRFVYTFEQDPSVPNYRHQWEEENLLFGTRKSLIESL